MLRNTTPSVWAAFLCLFVSSGLFAQREMVPALVVPKKGDTLRGFVLDEKWYVSPKFITFKASETAPNQVFYPRDIEQVILLKSNLIYQSAAVDLDTVNFVLSRSPTYQSVEKAREMTQFKHDTAFILTLVKGNLSLFQYVDEHLRSQYILHTEKKGYETLRLLRYRVYQNNRIEMATLEEYKTQIKSALSDCSASESDLSKLAYSGPDFQKLVENFNGCFSGNSYVYVEKKAFQWKIYALAGVAPAIISASDIYGDRLRMYALPMPSVIIGFERMRVDRETSAHLGIEFGIVNDRLNFSRNEPTRNRTYHRDYNMLGFQCKPYVKQVISTDYLHNSSLHVRAGLVFTLYGGSRFKEYFTAPNDTYTIFSERVTSLSNGISLAFSYRKNRMLFEFNPELEFLNNTTAGTAYIPLRFKLMAGYQF